MSAAATAPRFANVVREGRTLPIEYQWVGEGARTIVFLHEALGSLGLWRDFPRQLCEAAGARGLVYSRPGFGRSGPRDRWDPRFLHDHAYEVLPAFLEAVGLAGTRPWLFGHSDGASIALLHAARFPEADAGIVVVAPHIFVEEVTLEGIRAARVRWETSDWRSRLARHHDDVDAVFGGWNDLWLRPEFRGFNIEREIEAIRCPVLAAQGVDDEYGTLEQVRGIARLVSGTRIVELPGGHWPHRDHPRSLIDATVEFMAAR
ncbi:MAG TPA: alpha/beta hydrolase [Usitatibacter sp.]|nr:alpha/beta hydrolase [Usitatibacter sp.]